MVMPRSVLVCAAITLTIACVDSSGGGGLADEGTCAGVFPSYWQDPDTTFRPMWRGQTISNTPPEGWSGPVFRLSDAYPTERQDDAAAQPWRNARFDALFDPATDPATKTALARDYAWAVMRYIQDGNIGSRDVTADWTLCNNPVRPWFHMPFQTYDVMSGREFAHGLTREAPVAFSVKAPGHPDASITINGTMWAVGFYNATGAYTIGRVWKPDGRAEVPTDNLSFDEGTVVGKLLFSTATPAQLPMLANMPAWRANISDPAFCACDAGPGKKCTMIEESQQCARSSDAWGPVRLLQFDIAVKDHRAPVTEWVFGTFVADGQRKAGEANPWNRISPLGLMWGNDPPPAGGLASAYPADPRQHGFPGAVIFWETVDMLNAAGGAIASKRPGHLGCNNRLNGPADNANSSCLSCHMTASVPDRQRHTPPIIAQFQRGITHECVTPMASRPDSGTDATGAPSTVRNGIPFSGMDSLFFANIAAGQPVNMTWRGRNVIPPPEYTAGRPTAWRALDFSLQLSVSLTQWKEWQDDQAGSGQAPRVFTGLLPAR